MTGIVLENLCKNYGNVKALDNVSLEVKDGEFMVLLGPSGCGKTTLLLTIAGLEEPTSGNIYFSGKCVNDLTPKERNVAMVFQDYALYPHMSVYDNMSLCLKVSKVPKEEIKKRTKKTADLLEIGGLLDRKPGELSGGQQQRVALGRAIIRNPSVYFMDEPLSNLDAILRARMRIELKALHNKLGTTTIYVTHDQVEAMMFAERIAVMKNGKIIQVDTPKKIYEYPSEIFVAEFVGSPTMNFVEVALKEKNGKFYLDGGSFCLETTRAFSKLIKETASNTDLIMGVRPQHISVSLQPNGDFIETNVRLLQSAGDVTYVTTEIGQHVILIQIPTSFGEAIREKLFIRFNKKIYFFDKSSGKRLNQGKDGAIK